MKKSAWAMLLAFTVSSGAFAAGGFSGANSQSNNAGGGFEGPSMAVINVAKAKELRDENKVVLEGQIVEQIGGDTYLFRDKTGDITVEISQRKWPQERKITPKDKVRLMGEVDKDWNSVEIDVDSVQLSK